MRGHLSEKSIQEIRDKLPVIDEDLWLTATSLGLGVSTSDLTNEENLHTALVCLEDVYNRFTQVRLALHEAYACLKWYTEESPDAPQEFQAVLTARIYVDHIALIFYSNSKTSINRKRVYDSRVRYPATRRQRDDEDGQRLWRHPQLSSLSGNTHVPALWGSVGTQSPGVEQSHCYAG
jgi:hypothetical protein